MTPLPPPTPTDRRCTAPVAPPAPVPTPGLCIPRRGTGERARESERASVAATPSSLFMWGGQGERERERGVSRGEILVVWLVGYGYDYGCDYGLVWVDVVEDVT